MVYIIYFSGLPTKDPQLDLRLFLEVCDSFRQQGDPEDALRLKLFPYSLQDRVRAWLNAFPSGMMASWNELC
ncbi:protein FAR1-RELATED SEQUENCE 5-like [Gossypium australe]|uniref:Protein FAR1-RELATED SEQUENCE 5-like n=1 Tax=Gossypium australe TaxID=47621 RepID=A0A5B6VCW8_9ROSI|nr:protein FAR1-RELATED SEQUENCE 5-like [Gossypium australe]